MNCRPCNPNITAGPKPFYEEVKDTVVQDHATVIKQNSYAVGVLICDSWVVPEKNKDLAITLSGVVFLPIGAYLWNRQYGYYLITHWNPETGQVSIQNEEFAGNAAVGSFVRANTPFLVAPTPDIQASESTFFPYVAENFIAPPVDGTITVDVTSIFGLVVGDYVRMDTKLYKLQSIQSTKRITLLNEGGGFVSGTEVEAFNNEGEYQYFLVREVTAVCAGGDNTTEGRLIICDGGSQKILVGDTVGQVPILTDPASGTVEFGVLPPDTIPPGLIGTTELADNAVTNPKLADNSVGTAEIQNNAVTTAKIPDGAITTNKIPSNAVVTSLIADNNVTTAKIPDNAVTGPKIPSNAIGTAHIQNNAITTVKIPDANITTAKIANANIVNAHLVDDIVNSRVIGDLQVLGAHVANGAITESKIGAGAIINAHISPNTIKADQKIEAGTIINTLIANGTIHGYNKITPATLRGANILDTSIAHAKLGGIPGRSAGSTAIIDNTNVGLETTSGETWVWGPWIITRWNYDITFIGAKTNVDYGLFVSPYTAEGDQIWIGINRLTSAPSDGHLDRTSVFPICGSAARIRINLNPSAAAALDHIIGQAWLIYPWRMVDSAAEG